MKIVRTNNRVVVKSNKTVVNTNSTSTIKRTAVKTRAGGCCLKRK